MPSINTNVGTKTTTIVWTDADIALLQWAITKGYLGASSATTVVQSAEFLVKVGWLDLMKYYKAQVVAERQKAFDLANTTQQAASDADINFNPSLV